MVNITSAELEKIQADQEPQYAKETQLVAAIMQMLDRNDIKHWRQNQGGFKIGDQFVRMTKGMTGISDIVAFQPGEGRGIFIEVKIGKNKLSEKQAAFLKTMEATGCHVIEARSVGDVESYFRDHGIIR